MAKEKAAAVAGGAAAGASSNRNASAAEAFLIHLICCVGIAVALSIAQSLESVGLVSDPARTLQWISVIQCPIVILLFSLYRQNPQKCSYAKAVGRSILAMPAGALLNALGAIALGAPIGTQYLMKTIYWSCMMSAFTFLPAGSVFGASWSDWQRIFAFTKPITSIDFMICLPAHGAIIGAWFGAWPMPLDWERPWQDWPISVSFGAIFGYLLGMVASVILIFLRCRSHPIKVD